MERAVENIHKTTFSLLTNTFLSSLLSHFSEQKPHDVYEMDKMSTHNVVTVGGEMRRPRVLARGGEFHPLQRSLIGVNESETVYIHNNLLYFMELCQ